MSDGATLTISLPADTKARLSKLAGLSRRDESSLGAEAVADYVARELEIVEAIERGRADIEAGRVTPHEEVMAEIDALIEAMKRGR